MSYLEDIQRTGLVRNFNQTKTSAQSANTELETLKAEIASLKNRFERYAHISQNKLISLEKEVSQLREELSRTTEIAKKIQDQNVVQKTREALINRRDKPPVDRPIDRTGVSPSDVQVEKIFNFSGKRF